MLNFGLYFNKIGAIDANIPMMEIIAKRERQKVNQKIFAVNKEAVLKEIDKKQADKIIVRIGICFPIFNPNGKNASITNTGI
jgi:hypothetical protein